MRLRPLEFSLCHRLSPKPCLPRDRGKTESSFQPASRFPDAAESPLAGSDYQR
ncbi:hypothetical protein NBRC3257_0499 [Gluconobacter thailandicus NBRC 3257]|uniref:Uncharacterized protein n=1 Tax=Gluconobacter thailandicus NBRC 3257 TaxID=1381097 RepID=A0ABQ0ITK8_GLUTH|nr:hypothetical protein B932_2001 [Gluconobacter oxydans H24]GAC87540.1 hypothetical protein NBRC3255_1202 [Gluconobacter thailandicus NBRC 3255]GAD25500.1 hypothetical protein NBRC3257_0499 [Gluconobacter thailandicus NBRC 3257]